MNFIETHFWMFANNHWLTFQCECFVTHISQISLGLHASTFMPFNFNGECRRYRSHRQRKRERQIVDSNFCRCVSLWIHAKFGYFLPFFFLFWKSIAMTCFSLLFFLLLNYIFIYSWFFMMFHKSNVTFSWGNFQ